MDKININGRLLFFPPTPPPIQQCNILINKIHVEEYYTVLASATLLMCAKQLVYDWYMDSSLGPTHPGGHGPWSFMLNSAETLYNTKIRRAKTSASCSCLIYHRFVNSDKLDAGLLTMK